MPKLFLLKVEGPLEVEPRGPKAKEGPCGDPPKGGLPAVVALLQAGGAGQGLGPGGQKEAGGPKPQKKAQEGQEKDPKGPYPPSCPGRPQGQKKAYQGGPVVGETHPKTQKEGQNPPGGPQGHPQGQAQKPPKMPLGAKVHLGEDGRVKDSGEGTGHALMGGDLKKGQEGQKPPGKEKGPQGQGEDGRVLLGPKGDQGGHPHQG
ncbi:hypothetical protein CSW14_13755 [Thermus scotoductus]|uniref:Uncharacterized protein n=1 Tax=Thermus scotoductus TaxID=37636 RepID=A0A430V9S6_THESC|nr:hypothetical protein CSW14_13755 [Thermus scotoductus]